jgi:hypothetical protein
MMTKAAEANPFFNFLQGCRRGILALVSSTCLQDDFFEVLTRSIAASISLTKASFDAAKPEFMTVLGLVPSRRRRVGGQRGGCD